MEFLASPTPRHPSEVYICFPATAGYRTALDAYRNFIVESIVHVRPDIIRRYKTHVEAIQWLMDPSLLAKCRAFIFELITTSHKVGQGEPKAFELLHFANMRINKYFSTVTR